MKSRHTIAVSILIGLFVSAPGFAGQQTYEVKKGDNLYRIGKLFNTTPEELKKLNDLKDDKLEIGRILKVSADQPAAPTQAVKAPAIQDSVKTAADTDNKGQPQIQQVQQARKETQRYTVRQGDTISGIARSFNLSVKDITAANNLANSNRVNVGQVLVIPGENKTPGVAKAAPAASAQAADVSAVQSSAGTVADTGNPEQPQIQQVQQARKGTQTYTVRRGDTISGIAKTFNLGVKDIADANNLGNGNKLNAGQILVIPGENKTSSETQVAAASTQTVNKTDLNPPANENDEDLDARDRLVEAGFNLLGVRYRYGGTSEKTGLDCSALVKNLFEKFGFTLPRSSREQYKEGEKVAKEDLQKGDLVFFSSGGKTPTHVGIYIGDNQFLHAASRAKKVIISDLGKTWYDFRYLGARRILELWRDDAAKPSEDTQQEVSPVSVHSDNAPPGEFAASSASMENP